MALNIFPRKKETPQIEAETLPPDPVGTQPTTSPAEATGEERPAGARRRSGGGREGRSTRRRSQGERTTEAPAAESATPAAPAEEQSPPKGSTSRRGRRSRSSSRSAETTSEPKAPSEPAAAPSQAELWDALRELRQQVSELTTALRQQAEQVGRLLEALSADGRRGELTVAPPARVGVFVDVANIELAAERHGVRLDWGAVLEHLTEGRQLVRAIAYAPVHDDPEVSPEAQRFVEPFLDRGFKIVTKPLRRFSDGTIKANVDIEMALDIVTMSDRLDVVVLVSGDGDFTHLVDVVQSRGLRVEVAGFEKSTASVLRNAADRYIDLMPLAKRGRR